jgi:hypothetical protein
LTNGVKRRNKIAALRAATGKPAEPYVYGRDSCQSVNEEKKEYFQTDT